MKRILVVDDEPLILHALARTFQAEGFDVKALDNGTDAIDASRRSFYHVCMLDMGLPDMDGVEVVMKIRKQSPESKIFMMSASDLSGTAKEMIARNEGIFIPKPFELPYVKAIVHQVLQNTTVCGTASNMGDLSARNRRRLDRRPFSKAITYTVNCLDSFKAEVLSMAAHVVDINEAGMGIHTDYPVQLGSVIRFSGLLEVLDYMAGIVRNTCVVDKNLYRAGIEFV
ncbi:MAG: response regulator [Nitrospirae bacterium]|nr:response regulator [Nitrospirota bacterium]